MPTLGPRVNSCTQCLPIARLKPYAGVKLTFRPPEVSARNLIDMKSEELLYVLLPLVTLLAMLEYHLPSKESPSPIVP